MNLAVSAAGITKPADRDRAWRSKPNGQSRRAQRAMQHQSLAAAWPSPRCRSARGEATRCDVLVSGVLRECANAAAHHVMRCGPAGFELGELSAIEVEHEQANGR